MIAAEVVVVWSLPGGSSRRCTFAATCTIGRSPDSRILVPGAGVSRDHAVLELTPTGLTLRNVSASNVVLLTDRTLGPGDAAPMKPSDRFRVGPATLAVESIRRADAPTSAPTHLVCVKPDCRREVPTDRTDCPWCGTSMAFAQTSVGRG